MCSNYALLLPAGGCTPGGMFELNNEATYKKQSLFCCSNVSDGSATPVRRSEEIPIGIFNIK
jgi:hypothetical protein